MNGVKLLKGTPISPTIAEVPKPTGQLAVPGQGLVTAQLAAQSGQIAAQGAAANQAVASQASASLASANQAKGASYERQGGGLGNIAELGKAIVESFAGIQEARAKREQEQALFDLSRDADALRLNAPDIVSGDGGLAAFETAAQNLYTRYQGRVSFDQFEPIINRVTTAGRDAYKVVNTRLFEQSRELNDQQTAQAEATKLLELQPAFAKLGSLDPTMIQQGWDEITAGLQSIRESVPDLASVARISTAILDAARASNVSPERYVELQNNVVTYQSSKALQNEAYANWLQNQTPDGYRVYEQTMAEIESMYPGTVVTKNPTLYFQAAQSLVELKQATQEAVAQNPVYKSQLEKAQDFSGLLEGVLAVALAHPASGGTFEGRITQYSQEAEKAGLMTDWPGILQQGITVRQNIERLNPAVTKYQQAYSDWVTLRATLNYQGEEQLARIYRALQPQQRGQSLPDMLTLGAILQSPELLGIPGMQETLGTLQSQGPAAMTTEQAGTLLTAFNQMSQAKFEQAQANYETAKRDLDSIVGVLGAYSVQTDQGQINLVNFAQSSVGSIPVLNNDYLNYVAGQAQNNLQLIQNRLNAIQETIRLEQERTLQTTYGTQTSGGITNPFSNPPLAKLQVGEVNSPVPFRVGANITFTDHYLSRDGAHMGVDIAAPEGTEIINYIGGVVEAATTDPEGYGNLVDVRAHDGTLHRFAHLSRFNVTTGQQVLPGQVLGFVGNTGYSFGPHLHWEVMLSADSNGVTGLVRTDPFDWASKHINTQQPAVRGPSGQTGATGQVPVAGGGVYQNGLVAQFPGVPGAQPVAYTAQQPLPRAYEPYTVPPGTRSKPEDNYGYAVLKEDRPFRLALTAMANRLGIPAKWIADIMAHETGGTFDPNEPEIGGAAGIGLLQMHKETRDGLLRNHPHLRLEDFFSGDRVRQLKWVEAYLSEMSSQIHTAFDLAVAVNRGQGELTRFQADPVTYLRDSGIADYIEMMGRFAGRQYKPISTYRVVHTRRVSTCTVCQNMGNSFQPHEA